MKKPKIVCLMCDPKMKGWQVDWHFKCYGMVVGDKCECDCPKNKPIKAPEIEEKIDALFEEIRKLNIKRTAVITRRTEEWRKRQ